MLPLPFRAAARVSLLLSIGLVLQAHARPFPEQEAAKSLEPGGDAAPRYASTSRIYVQPDKATTTRPADDVRSAYLSLQCKALRSPALLGHLTEIPEIKALPVFSKIPNQIAYLRRHVRAEVGKRDDIITITLESPDPHESAVLVNSLVKTYIEDRQAEAENGGSPLLKRLEAYKAKRVEELEQTRDQIQALRKSDPNLKLEASADGNPAIEKLRAASQALDEVNRRIAANAGTDGPETRQMQELRRLAEIYDQAYRDAKAEALKTTDKQQQIDALRVSEERLTAEMDPLERRITELQINLNVQKQISPVVILEAGVANPKPVPSQNDATTSPAP
jgi:hypothetical protein